MDQVLQANGIPWSNCVGTSVDNTSVNMGVRNSIRSRALAQNSAIYFMGCPCHIVHNTCMKASEEFSKVCQLVSYASLLNVTSRWQGLMLKTSWLITITILIKVRKKKRTSWLNTATFVMWSIGGYLNMLAPDGWV